VTLRCTRRELVEMALGLGVIWCWIGFWLWVLLD